ncbi:MAG: zinc-ribbon domain-containing protein [Bacteroidales bacterium]|nr:zinc-ribbon domain-containing protein [Bacteroidales bacterium]
MKCKHCGEKIAEDSKYCEFCGKNIKVIVNPWKVISIVVAVVGAIWIICLYWQNHEDVETKEWQIETLQNDKNFLEMKMEEQNTFINIISNPAQIYVMRSYGTSQINFCNGIILDPGGTDDYSNDCDCYLEVVPDISHGYGIKLQGPFHTEKGFDYIDIYERTTNEGDTTHLAHYTGDGDCDVTSTNGDLLIHFHSDASIVRSGFIFSVSCVPIENYDTLKENCKKAKF